MHVVHDTVLVVVPGYENSEKLDEFIKEVPEEYKEYFLKVFAVNGYISYIISPDGSGESFQTSNDMGELRKKFIEIAKTYRCDIVHIRFGGDWCLQQGSPCVMYSKNLKGNEKCANNYD